MHGSLLVYVSHALPSSGLQSKVRECRPWFQLHWMQLLALPRDRNGLILPSSAVQESLGLHIKLSLVSDTLSWSSPLQRGGNMGGVSPLKPRYKEDYQLSSRMSQKALWALVEWLQACNCMIQPIAVLHSQNYMVQVFGLSAWAQSKLFFFQCRIAGSTIQTKSHLSQCHFMCRNDCLQWWWSHKLKLASLQEVGSRDFVVSLKKSGICKKKRHMLELLLLSLVHEKCVSSSALWTWRDP